LAYRPDYISTQHRINSSYNKADTTFRRFSKLLTGIGIPLLSSSRAELNYYKDEIGLFQALRMEREAHIRKEAKNKEDPYNERRKKINRDIALLL
jgi:hypothetical protein